MKRLAVTIVLLSAGLLVYWIFSPGIYVFKIMGIGNTNPVAVTGPFSAFCKNHLPDIFWAIAVNNTVVLLKQQNTAPFYIYALMLLPFTSEVLQYTRFIPGTFDWYDLFTYLFVYLLFFNSKINRLCNIRSLHLPAR